MNLRTVRSGGLAGIVFLLIIAGSFLLTGMLPDNGAAVQDIAAYNDAHRTGLLISGWFGVPAIGLFLWFAVGLYRWQISVSANND